MANVATIDALIAQLATKGFGAGANAASPQIRKAIKRLKAVDGDGGGKALPNDAAKGDTYGTERFSESSYSSYDDYFEVNNPQARIDSLIQDYGLEKHLNGKIVKYNPDAPRSGVEAGVRPWDHNTIHIYDEGLSLGDRRLFETLIEEIHHSKLMGIAPHTRAGGNFNKVWNSIVEPRAKSYAKRYADRVFGTGN